MFLSLRSCDASQKKRVDRFPYPWVFHLCQKGIKVTVTCTVHFSPNLPVGCLAQDYQKLVDFNLKVVSKGPESGKLNPYLAEWTRHWL